MANFKLNSVLVATESGGTVTLDNGVQDNITRLGTVASGAIDSGVTFPAGHTIKTHSMNIRFTTGSHSMTLSSTLTPVVYASATGTAGGTMQITGITATEGNLLHITANGGEPRAQSDSTYETILGYKIDSEEHAQYEVYQNSTYAMWNGHVGMVYTVPANFTNKTISLCARKEGSSNTMLMQVRAARAPVTLWMLVSEIQQ